MTLYMELYTIESTLRRMSSDVHNSREWVRGRLTYMSQSTQSMKLLRVVQELKKDIITVKGRSFVVASGKVEMQTEPES